MTFLLPFNQLSYSTPLSEKELHDKISANLLEANIYALGVDLTSPQSFKGRWFGNLLVAVRPQENFWIAGNVLLVRTAQRNGVSSLRVRMVGNIFVTLLFLVVIVQWIFLGMRVISSMAGCVPVSIVEHLGLAHFWNSPLIHVLISSGFYFVLYLNLVRKGFRHWKKLLPTILH